MGYILNGLEVEQAIETDVEVVVDIMSRLDIVSIDTVDHSSVYKSYNSSNNFIVRVH